MTHQEDAYLAVDGHVHLHQWNLVEPTLDAAAANLSRAGARPPALLGALMLAQSSHERVFEQLAESPARGRWSFHPVDNEPQALIACRDNERIALICGRQVRCALGLEVLALGTLARYPDGRDFNETVDRVRADGALTVVPWGFGKWAGRAGREVRALFNNSPPESLFAGDNGGRMQITGMPTLLEQARGLGIRILPGTDPFPIASDYRRVGAFGFYAAIAPDPSRPWAVLSEWLQAGGVPRAYGRALGPLRFARNQGLMQVRNRLVGRLR